MRAENAPRLIAIGAPGPGHGKSTLARALSGFGGYQVRSFARPMKAMAEGLLRELGWSWNSIDLVLTDPIRKEEVIPELGVSMRHFLQRLGTEFGRQQIHENLWIDVWRHAAQRPLADGMGVVVDDLRFANEYQAMRDMGALLIYVIREDAPEVPWSHASDGKLRASQFDLVIDGVSKEELMRWGERICRGEVPAPEPI